MSGEALYGRVARLAMPVAALVAALAAIALGPPERTLVLAIVGGALVATNEAAARLAERRRWPSTTEEPAGKLSRRTDFGGALALGAAGAFLGWGIVVAGSAAAWRGWGLLLLGALASLVVIGAVVYGVAVSSPTPPRPSPRGRRPGRGTRHARSSPPDLPEQSSG